MLFNPISHQLDIDKTNLYAKDSHETRCQFLTNNRQITGLKHLNDFKAFIEYSNNKVDNYENIREDNPNKKLKMLIVFVDMNADMLSNKKPNPIKNLIQ